LLFFEKGGKKIRRYSGPRTFDAIAKFAQSGWKDVEEYVPADQPPPKPRPTLTESLKTLVTKDWKIAAALGTVVVVFVVFLLLLCFGGMPRDTRLPAEGASADAKRTFGNVPLSSQKKRPSKVD